MFQDEQTQYQYNFMQMLNNLFKVCWKLKKADIICHMLSSLVYLEQENVEKTQKFDEYCSILTKKIFLSFERFEEFQWNNQDDIKRHKKAGLYFIRLNYIKTTYKAWQNNQSWAHRNIKSIITSCI